MNRRKFVSKGLLSSLGTFIGGTLKAGQSLNENEEGKDYGEIEEFDLMKEVLKFRKIDAHAHNSFSENSPARQIDDADRMGIEKLVISNYLHVMPGTPDQFRAYNDRTISDIKRYPDRLLGGFVLNPTFRKESLDEIERCEDAGMIGTGELYYQVKISDPMYAPIIERLIEKKMIIFCHGECQLGVGGYRMKYIGNKQPNTNIPEDLVEVANRYPEGIFQWAHISGGGDWEYMCKAFRDYPNIFVDVSGSNNDEHIIDFAVEVLGEDRVFFGIDLFAQNQAVGRIMSSNLNDRQKQKIFFDNYNNALKTGGRNVD